MQIYNENKQTEQGKMQNAQFKEKGDARKQDGAKSCVQGDKQMKENPDVEWKKGSGDLRARSCPAKLQLAKRN